MPIFFVNKFDNGNGVRLMHKAGCYYLPISKTLSISLGEFKASTEAILEARKISPLIEICQCCVLHQSSKLAEKTHQL